MAAREKTTSATAMNGPSSSEIAIAAAAHTWEFAIYVAVGIFVAIVLAFLTWRVWMSGNRLQDAIRHDADARIEEARRELKKLEWVTAPDEPAYMINPRTGGFIKVKSA